MDLKQNGWENLEFSVDLIKCAVNYLSFSKLLDDKKHIYYQLSLPHFQQNEYLELCLQRYKKFLYLKKLYPDQLVLPCVGIELMWRAHQLNQTAYASDTTKILGYFF